ncbi:hypothetical protein SCLCIDRAFT_26701 [Scleroderma citrinum Foug A]|uniref:Zn(2)-C6 fungal-type domain-containing protein n=1 Tax=Scleroderma citrinum Foug A TaxID=1036808 RepID=A0A0C3DWS0_9AGAM|nr:hypothetical protein SCLCIDRAFT_26701 [Scleroderma citrinum Foug A]
MSQQHATTSSPILTGEDHAEGVVAHAAKVITQYTNGLKQHNNLEYWNKTTQVVWDELQKVKLVVADLLVGFVMPIHLIAADAFMEINVEDHPWFKLREPLFPVPTTGSPPPVPKKKGKGKGKAKAVDTKKDMDGAVQGKDQVARPVVRGRSRSQAPSVGPAKKKGKERAVKIQVEGKINGVNDDKETGGGEVRGQSQTRQVGPSKKGKEKATSVEVEKERTKDVEQASKQKSSEETKSQQCSEKIASAEVPKHSDQTNTSFLAPVGFGPVRPEESCDRCRRAGKTCLVKKGMACLHCHNMKMKCTLTDKLHGKSQVQSEESQSSSHQPRSPSRVPSEVVPPVTPRPAKHRRSSSMNPTPGPSKVKAGADERSSRKIVEVYIDHPPWMPTSKSQDVSLAPTLAASMTDPPTTPSSVETSSMTNGDMLEDQVSCLKKDMVKMKEDTDQDILLLKHDNARMKVELEQNREELETLQALVEAIQEQQFSTTPALHDPSVPPPQSGPGHTIPSVPTSVHSSPPPALYYHGPMSPSIHALLAPHPPSPSPISPIQGLDTDEASSSVPVVLPPGPMDIINIPANNTDKPDDTPVMD